MEILSTCEDKHQGQTALNLYTYLSKAVKIHNLKSFYDPELKMIILEVKISECQPIQLIVPTYYTFFPSVKWMRDVIEHLGKLYPDISIIIAFSSSDQKFVMYRISKGLAMPKNVTLEDLRKMDSKD